MADEIDLTGYIASSIDTGNDRGHPVVVSYVTDDGAPAATLRGSAHVHGPKQIAIWVRKRDDGLAVAIADRPKVSVLYFGKGGPGPHFVTMRGVARVAEDANDVVYETMPEVERTRDADRNGVAVLIDIDYVRGNGPDGPFEQKG